MRLILPLAASCLIALECYAQSGFPHGFPQPTPVADANPAVREERDVPVPTALEVLRTADVLEVSNDDNAMKPIKMQVGSKMVLGTSFELYIYPADGVRPAKPQMSGLGLGGTALFHPKRNGIPQPGKPCIVEMDVTLFETDIPPQHFWSPQSGKYKVLWQTTLRQTVKEGNDVQKQVQPQPTSK